MNHSKFRRIVGACTVIAVALTIAGCPRRQDRVLQPPPPPPQSEWGAIRLGGGKCLDIANDRGRIHQGVSVRMWDCNGLKNQQWKYEGGKFVSLHDRNLCLDADGPAARRNGGRVLVWSCHGRSNQRWTIDANGQLRNEAGNLCLDADHGGRHLNGGKVQVWSCHGGENQRWTFR